MRYVIVSVVKGPAGNFNNNLRKEVFEKLAYIDIVNFSSKLSCDLLIGTGLLDSICPPSTQYAVFNNVNCKKKHLIFHKYGHELNNFFENENLKFMQFNNVN